MGKLKEFFEEEKIIPKWAILSNFFIGALTGIIIFIAIMAMAFMR